MASLPSVLELDAVTESIQIISDSNLPAELKTRLISGIAALPTTAGAIGNARAKQQDYDAIINYFTAGQWSALQSKGSESAKALLACSEIRTLPKR